MYNISDHPFCAYKVVLFYWNKNLGQTLAAAELECFFEPLVCGRRRINHAACLSQNLIAVWTCFGNWIALENPFKCWIFQPRESRCRWLLWGGQGMCFATVGEQEHCCCRCHGQRWSGVSSRNMEKIWDCVISYMYRERACEVVYGEKFSLWAFL